MGRWEGDIYRKTWCGWTDIYISAQVGPEVYWGWIDDMGFSRHPAAWTRPPASRERGYTTARPSRQPGLDLGPWGRRRPQTHLGFGTMGWALGLGWVGVGPGISKWGPICRSLNPPVDSGRGGGMGGSMPRMGGSMPRDGRQAPGRPSLARDEITFFFTKSAENWAVPMHGPPP